MPMNDEILEYLKDNIKEKRVHHIIRVADTARKLADLHKVSAEKVYTAALLHDSAKGNEESLFTKYKEILSKEWNDLDEDLKAEPIVHGPLAGILAREEFGIEDEEILNAIVYHTTGRENMTKVEEIVYLADKLEPKRDYPKIEEIRNIAKIDLEKAMLLSFDNAIEYLIDRKEPIAMITIRSRNNLLRR
ncbi:MAG: bis(5'-nucleosyl)-tetraphosphatase (symmetrical) YqeK [Gallicola sp.]|nr:bis(5'-nucleosyl)-tetraphosphatase (symmetrical) YqeK [Gallicola sp.]